MVIMPQVLSKMFVFRKRCYGNYKPHSFSRSMEQEERIQRHNDVIWQLVKLWFGQNTW